MALLGSASTQGGPDTVEIPLYILVKLLEANGGAIALDGLELRTTGSKLNVEMYELRDPWRVVVRLVEPDWHDPTHGKIDRDIQEYVEKVYNTAGTLTIGTRTAVEETLQNKRNKGEKVVL